MEETTNKSETPTNRLLADSASFWMNSDKSTVQKKQEIMKRCFEQAVQRFEKPNGVSNNFFIWTMLVMAILGLIAAWLQL
jgi:hypothetical protein